MPAPLPAQSILEFRDLTFGYGERAVLDGINLTIPRGKVTALMGASGGGKTTLLRLMGGQYRAQKGELLLHARTGTQDITRMDQTAMYQARRGMGMLFQFGALFTDLSVFDNVAFPLREHTDLPPALIRDIVLMKLHAVGLRGAQHLMPAEISGGMSRRVAMARAMALDPELLLYDEPFSGLDPISLGTVAHLIRQLNDTMGLTSVVVSHELEQTFAMADHVVLLANGQIAAQGSPQEVHDSTDPRVVQYVLAQADGPVRFHYPGQSAEHDFGPAGGDTP
jgi:phospholipid/cholesterol/gamma-HCH transport system ATP-binding protein